LHVRQSAANVATLFLSILQARMEIGWGRSFGTSERFGWMTCGGDSDVR
jgi:hypothetical protein